MDSHQGRPIHLAVDLRTVDDHFPGIARYAYELSLALAGLAPALRLTLILPTAPRHPL